MLKTAQNNVNINDLILKYYRSKRINDKAYLVKNNFGQFNKNFKKLK